ncbi:MAG TPA: NlpC/P60 family protein [Desulfosporosinus sp.]|nr:NlpC/P60 family protein [Desulfosporosinus sp.]
MKKVLKLVAMAVCLLAVSQISYTAKPVYGAQAVVKTETVGIVTANSSLNLRKSASTSAVTLTSLPNNAQVVIISKNAANWYNVTYKGQTGWVSGQYLSVKTIADTSETPVVTVPSEEAKTKTVGTVTASSGLNLRESAVSTSVILSSIPNNAQVTVISKNTNNWYNVEYNGQTGWVSGSYLTVKTVAATTPVTNVSRSVSSELVEHALSLQGVPYVFGGTSRSGFDCSGYTQYVFKESGISLPRTTAEQYKAGSSVNRDKLQAGDLVFFSTYASGASHVGIYIGGGSFVDASNAGVGISNLDKGYYTSRYLGARRVR